jgi:hypothetical protein
VLIWHIIQAGNEVRQWLIDIGLNWLQVSSLGVHLKPVYTTITNNKSKRPITTMKTNEHVSNFGIFGGQTIALPELDLTTSVNQQIADLLSQNKFFIYGEQLFKKVCTKLNLQPNNWVITVFTTHLSGLQKSPTAADMLRIVPLEMRPHFLKIYLDLLEQ